MGKPSVLERMFITHWRTLAPGCPAPVEEYQFHASRRWRFDFAWPGYRVAVECEGGIWTRGRHTRGQGFEDDCWKYNAAAAMGWRVLRFTQGMMATDPQACVNLIIEAMGGIP